VLDTQIAPYRLWRVDILERRGRQEWKLLMDFDDAISFGLREWQDFSFFLLFASL
jgi:hypothetical protein